MCDRDGAVRERIHRPAQLAERVLTRREAQPAQASAGRYAIEALSAKRVLQLTRSRRREHRRPRRPPAPTPAAKTPRGEGVRPDPPAPAAPNPPLASGRAR